MFTTQFTKHNFRLTIAAGLAAVIGTAGIAAAAGTGDDDAAPATTSVVTTVHTNPTEPNRWSSK